MKKVLEVTSMKRVVFVAAFLLGFSLSAFAQPATKQDIEQLKEQLKTYIDLKIEALSNELKGEIKALNATVVEMDKRLSSQITEMDKRSSGQITILMWMIGILAGFIGLLIALPQILDFFQVRKGTQAKLEKLEAEQAAIRQENVVLRQEIADLKTRMIS